MNATVKALLIQSAVMLLFQTGCGQPTPNTVTDRRPPLPPPPPAEPEPEPPQPEQQLDAYEIAMTEVGGIIKRYGVVYSSVKDEATADKAVEEIGQMTARLRELATAIPTFPVLPGQEKHALALQAEMTQLQTAQLTNPEMQRVLSDPEIGLKFIAAHQSFVTEGLLPIGQAVVARQPSEPQATKAPTSPPGVK